MIYVLWTVGIQVRGSSKFETFEKLDIIVVQKFDSIK